MGTRVALQQRQRLFRDGLVLLLGKEADLQVVGAVVTGPELVDLCEAEQPDVAVMEVDTGGWDACRVAARLLAGLPDLRFVGMHQSLDDDAQLARSRAAGLTSLVPRSGGIGLLLAAIREALRRPTVACITVPAAGLQQRGPLTPRELDVLRHVGAG